MPSEATLPAALGVMVLPGAVLLPGALLPLYIFEPRYREMLADALDESRTFVVVQRIPEADEPYNVGTAGIIRACVANRDGTSHLILQGVHRVRFAEWLPGRAYRRARLEVLPSCTSSDETAASLQKELRGLCLAILRERNSPDDPVAATLEQTTCPCAFSDLVAGILVHDPSIQQHLLEEQDCTRRLEIVAAYLSKTV